MLDTLKGAVQSKTMWFNAGLTALGIFGWVTDHAALILAAAPQAAPLLTIIGAIGMVLRVLTESTPAWQAPVETAVPKAVESMPG